jgi:TetR/AcrR family tetracycline transcriptional repressor
MAPRTGTATRERLSRESIAEGALELADREGLDAVTIRRLATDNSVTPMALYWHFKDKDALLDGIAERIYSDVRLPGADQRTWDIQLRAILEPILAAVRPHPLVSELLAERVMKSIPGLILSERAIGLLRSAGFSPAEASQIAAFLLCSIITLVTSEPGAREKAGEDVDAITRAKRAQLESLDPKLFPNLLEAAEFFLVCEDEDSYYARGIDFLIEGVRGLLTA